jgi:GNAT superfamily N-acetyltransferase
MCLEECAMIITLRPLNLATDAPRLAALIATAQPEPVTPESLHEQEQHFPVGRNRRRCVALDHHRGIVGYVETAHYPWLPTQHFWLWIVVDPAAQRQGIGTQLYQDGLAFAQAQDATRLYSQVRDSCPICLRFAQQCGFTIARHLWESTLDLLHFDTRPFAGVVGAVAATGIRFFTLADVDTTLQVQQRLYDLNQRTGLDNPSSVAAWPSFEEFCTLLFGAPWYRPDGQIIAADGDQWVGMASVGYIAEANAMDNMFTGVERAYRGRKIGLALKLLAIGCARKYGATAMRTSNDSENAPMLAINQKLGYHPHAGRYRLMQDLHERPTHADSILPVR